MVSINFIHVIYIITFFLRITPHVIITGHVENLQGPYSIFIGFSEHFMCTFCQRFLNKIFFVMLFIGF